MPDARDMVSLLWGRSLRSRTGILLLEPHDLSRTREIAVRLGARYVDYAAVVLESLPEGTSFVPLSADAEWRRLDTVDASAGGWGVALVANFDLALARLQPPERDHLWATIRDGMPHRTLAFIFAMPAGAVRLLPPEQQLAEWRNAGRLASLTEF